MLFRFLFHKNCKRLILETLQFPDLRCDCMGSSIAQYAMEMGIALIIVAVVIPIGLVMIAEANLTGVNASVATIITIVFPILAILGLAIKFMPQELKSRVGI